jgi:hypothetical protein
MNEKKPRNRKKTTTTNFNYQKNCKRKTTELVVEGFRLQAAWHWSLPAN